MTPGYQFNGWVANQSSYNSQNQYYEFYMPDHNLTITPTSSNATITVTFNGNGGSSSTKNVTYLSTYGTLPTTKRYGYSFKGWYTAPSGGTKITNYTQVTNTTNHTIYAQWLNLSMSAYVNESSDNEIYNKGNYRYTYTNSGLNIIPQEFYCDFRFGNYTAELPAYGTFNIEGCRVSDGRWETIRTFSSIYRSTKTRETRAAYGSYSINTNTAYSQFAVRFNSTDNERRLYIDFRVY